MSADDDAFRERLRHELVGAARRERDRSRRRIAAIGAAVLAVLAGAAVAVVAVADRGDADPVEIEVVDGDVEVRIVDLEADPDEIRRELLDAGVAQVRIEAVPVAPDQVGRFVTLAAPPEVVTVLDPDPASDGAYTGFRVPRGLSEPIEVFLGRAAGEGEPWATTPSAFRPEGPLACRGLVGERVADVRAEIERAAPDVRWFADDLGPRPADALGGHLVAAAVQTGPDALTVFVVRDLEAATTMDDQPPGCDEVGAR